MKLRPFVARLPLLVGVVLVVAMLVAGHTAAFGHSIGLGDLGNLDGLEQAGLDPAGFRQVPVWLAQILLALAWTVYVAGAWRKPPRAGPQLAFHAAMLLSGWALFGPLDTWAERSTAWHMAQHMLLIVAVAPLAVLARPLPQWRALLGPAADAVWRPLHRLSRRPMACALLHAAAIWFWHAPAPYIAALETPLWHVLEHASFLFSGWLFWWSVLRPGRARSLWAGVALLFTVMHTGLLGALLCFASVPLYNTGVTALEDQQLAGLIMWVPGGIAYLLAAVGAIWDWLAPKDTPSASGAPIRAVRSAV